ncbi:uncharacterized protein LOC123535311 isoform X2 [Mercenaria mercenaria]|nr:uncharacterized protein LOC123535311 isoform X2 [Mercenaria mercenaria]
MRCDKSCPKTGFDMSSYEECCTCRNCMNWEGSEIDLFIEYVSVLGRSLVLSEHAPSQDEVYQIEHKDSEMTEIPSNLCNSDNDTNLMESYQELFENMTQFWGNIIKLNFESNKIRQLPDLNCLHRLDELNLKNNKLIHISNTSIFYLSSLRRVDFSGNYIQKLDPKILTSPHLSLFIANFSKNEMTQLDFSNAMSLYPFCHISYESNKITEITNELSFKLNLNKTYGPGFVSIENNLISTFPDLKELLFLDDLAQLGKLISFGFDFRGIPLVCDCNLEPFMTLALDIIKVVWRDYLDVKCTAPEDLAGISVADVDPALFTCPILADSGCQTPECTCVDKPNEDTLYVDCSNSQLTKIPKLPNSKYSKFISLNVSGNKIKKLDNTSILSKLSMLDISRNNLNIIDEKAASLLENASYIDLSYNPNLRQLPQTFQYHNVCSRNMFNLQIICDCQFVWIEKWVHSRQCTNLDKLFKCDIPETGIKPAIQFTEENLECFKTEKSYILEILMGGLVLILILAGSLIYYFRYEILIICLRARQKRQNEVTPLYKYDVFLSYNDTDDNVSQWVNRILVSNLIKTGYRVFQPNRDVAFGSERNSEIIPVISKTRNFLVIMSDSYLAEAGGMRSWTENEFKFGWNNFKADKSKNIVLVNFDHMSSFDVIHSQIKAFLRVGCTVDFKNRDGTIMEEIYTKLGKPVHLPKIKEITVVINEKYSPYEHFKASMYYDDNLLKNEELEDQTENSSADDETKPNEDTVTVTDMKVTLNTTDDISNKDETFKGANYHNSQRHVQKCQFRKCYACRVKEQLVKTPNIQVFNKKLAAKSKKIPNDQISTTGKKCENISAKETTIVHV